MNKLYAECPECYAEVEVVCACNAAKARAQAFEEAAQVLDVAAADARTRAKGWAARGSADMFEVKSLEATALEEQAAAIRAKAKEGT